MKTLLLYVSLISSIKAQGNGAVRLYRHGETSHLYTSGVVQVFYSGAWGNICFDSNWTNSEADVVCRQLGWSGSSFTAPAFNEIGSYGFDESPTVIGNVQCTGDNTSQVLLQCNTSRDYGSFCSDNYDVTVSCYTTKLVESIGYPGMLRLIGGSYITDGRVEIYCNNEWGTVCDDGISGIEADTICRHLGYSESVRYDHLILPGNATQPIWLDDVSCGMKAKDCINSCQQCPSREIHNCVHGEDLTVACTYRMDNGGSNFSTCMGIEFDSEDNIISLIIGIVISGIIVMVLLIIVIVTCCILLCGATKNKRTINNQIIEEKVPSSTIMDSSSTQVIPMDCSPKMYRKEYQENHYVEQTTNNHSKPGVAGYNPYFGNGEVDIEITNDCQYVTTPPAYLGSPASGYYEGYY